MEDNKCFISFLLINFFKPRLGVLPEISGDLEFFLVARLGFTKTLSSMLGNLTKPQVSKLGLMQIVLIPPSEVD